MKKRAVLSAALSVMLAGVMCVGLAACGDDTAESMKGEEVTAEEWAAAFSAENFENVKIECETSYKTNDDQYGEIKTNYIIVIADGKAYYQRGTEGIIFDNADIDDVVNVEEYAQKTANGIAVYQKRDGIWKEIDEPSKAFMSVSTYPALAAQYESFEYSEEKGGYVMKANAGMNAAGLRALAEESGETVVEQPSSPIGSVLQLLQEAVWKFKDGKLAAAWMDYEGVLGVVPGNYITGTMTSSMTFTYGGQSVTLPEIGA